MQIFLVDDEYLSCIFVEIHQQVRIASLTQFVIEINDGVIVQMGLVLLTGLILWGVVVHAFSSLLVGREE